jgi:hypothetical protein
MRAGGSGQQAIRIAGDDVGDSRHGRPGLHERAIELDRSSRRGPCGLVHAPRPRQRPGRFDVAVNGIFGSAPAGAVVDVHEGDGVERVAGRAVLERDRGGPADVALIEHARIAVRAGGVSVRLGHDGGTDVELDAARRDERVHPVDDLPRLDGQGAAAVLEGGAPGRRDVVQGRGRARRSGRAFRSLRTFRANVALDLDG